MKSTTLRTLCCVCDRILTCLLRVVSSCHRGVQSYMCTATNFTAVFSRIWYDCWRGTTEMRWRFYKNLQCCKLLLSNCFFHCSMFGCNARCLLMLMTCRFQWTTDHISIWLWLILLHAVIRHLCLSWKWKMKWKNGLLCIAAQCWIVHETLKH